MFRPQDRFIAAVVVTALLINVGSSHISITYPGASALVGYGILTFILFWGAVLLGRLGYRLYTRGTYAVEAFVLDDKDRLLVYHHPFHKRFLPPGGRMNPGEFPDEALRSRLKERLGINPEQYIVINLAEIGVTPTRLGRIQHMPTPFLVQKELTQQRNLKSFHYDFLYLLRLYDGWTLQAQSAYEPVKFVTLHELEQDLSSSMTLPDVVETYRILLARLANLKNLKASVALTSGERPQVAQTETTETQRK